MSTNADFIPAEVIDQFFAPVQHDALTGLVSRYEAEKAGINALHDFLFTGKGVGSVGYFLRGNDAEGRGIPSVADMFHLDGALNQLTADYWSKVMQQTGMMEEMPQARRQQWFSVLSAWKERDYKRGANPELDMPEFNLDNVRATIQSLVARRADFLAERVDGIFRNLSPSHKTNLAVGFSKRMIISGVFDELGSTSHRRVDTIHDLRVVIAKFMGRDDICRSTTERILKGSNQAAHVGEWQELDGGALRIRTYKVGTAHLEVHPDMAWRLNCILAHLHPAAIPADLRKAPKTRKRSGFGSQEVHSRPLPGAVINILSRLEPHYELVPAKGHFRDYDRVPVRNAFSFRYAYEKPSVAAMREAEDVLASIGGVAVKPARGSHYWQFDYRADSALNHIIATGTIPDVKAHQYYPTPESVASRLEEWLDIQDDETVCEPEAGQGGIAKHLPKDRTVCVEINELHCTILQGMGFQVVQGDSLSWEPAEKFDVVAMNPPYSAGRWQAHLQNAVRLLKEDGRLGAVLPLSARNQAIDLLPGFELEFSQPIDNAFAGTSISVVLLKATRKVASKGNGVGVGDQMELLVA